MTTNLIIPVGIPGCGKSTWPGTLLRNYRLVSTDEIRKEMFGSLRAAHDVSPEQRDKNNQEVFQVFHTRIGETLESGVDTYADATNLHPRARRRLRVIADRAKAKIHIVFFDNVQQAWNRNRLRDEETCVPSNVMSKMMTQFFEAKQRLLPLDNHPLEEFDALTVISGVSKWNL